MVLLKKHNVGFKRLFLIIELNLRRENMNKMLKSFLHRILPEMFLKLLKKTHYCRLLRKYSEKEEPDFAIVKYLVKRGQTVVDIGANVGFYTKLLSELVAEDGLVISIEPIPETFSILSSCVSRLGLKNVMLLKYAVSDKNGYAMMEVPKYDTGGFNYYQSRIIENNTECASSKNFPVEMKTLDTLLSSCERRIAFIKCDVEGKELAVVKGAVSVITKFRPALLIEVSSDLDYINSTARELFYILQKYGYDAYLFDGRKLRRRQKSDKSINYFFLAFEHLHLIYDII